MREALRAGVPYGPLSIAQQQGSAVGHIHCILGADFGEELCRSWSLWAVRETGGLSGRVVAVQRRGRIPDMFRYVGGFSVKCELEGNNLRILRE